MSTKQVTLYAVVCDRCGRDAFEDGEYAAYTTEESARSVVEDMDDWLVVGDKHYCDDCTGWDEELNERAPLPPVVTP